jgi:organic radical activating enzyme
MISLNTQPAEKPDLREDGSADVNNIFLTVQGEGPLAGTPAMFVRLAGCDLQCPHCDTDYTGVRERVTPHDLYLRTVSVAKHSHVFLLVVTGGEPFRQEIGFLCHQFLSRGWRVQIETNGTLPPSREFQTQRHHYGSRLSVVCSPKTPKIHPELAPLVTAYKYVLDADHVDPSDGLPTSVLGLDVRPARPQRQLREAGLLPRYNTPDVYVQPADHRDPERNKANMRAAVGSCLKHGYRMSVQTHKILGLE